MRLPTELQTRRLFSFTVPLMGILAVLIAVPMFFMFYGSLRSANIGDPTGSFTFEHLRTVYTTTPYLRTIVVTLALATIVSSLSLVVGAVFAWLVSRTDLPRRGLIELCLIAPLFLSPFVGAVAWLILGSPRAGFINVAAEKLLGADGPVINTMSSAGVVAIMSLYYVPYGYLYISGSLRNMDPALEEASYLNGSGILGTVRRVTAPITKPALMSAFFFIFVLSAGLFSIPAVLGGNSGLIPLAVRIFRSTTGFPIKYGEAAALGTVLFLLTVGGIAMYRAATKLANRFVTITARGYRPRLVHLGAWRWPAFGLCVAYIVLAIVLPYSTLLYVSVTPYLTSDLFSAQFTLDTFREMLASVTVQDALMNSLVVSVVTPTITVVIGVVLAFTIHRLRAPGSRWLDYLATVPVAVPGIVFATGMLWAFVQTPLYGTIWILVVANVAVYIAHSLRSASTSLIQIDKHLEEASAVSGAAAGHTIRRITFPLVKPAVLSSWIMVFIFTSREISSAILLVGPDSNVLPVLTWDYLQNGSFQNAAVIGLIQTAFLIVGIILAKYVLRVRLTSQAGS